MAVQIKAVLEDEIHAVLKKRKDTTKLTVEYQVIEAVKMYVELLKKKENENN